jgi:outer membrane protein TolC
MKKTFLTLMFCFTMCGLSYSRDTLSLEESIEIGLKNNFVIQVEDEKLIQAKMEKEEAHTYFFPKISSSFTYTRLDEAGKMTFGLPDFGIPPISFKLTDANLYNLGFTLTQPIYTGNKIQSYYKKSIENIQRIGFDKDITCQDLILEIKKGYFNILKAEKMLQTAVSLKTSASEHRRIAEAFFNEGLVTKIDILKTKIFLTNTEQQILQAQNAVILLKSNFEFLLNSPLPEGFKVKDVLELQKELISLEHWLQLAFQQRPEIKKMESLSEMYQQDINIAKSELKPNIAFFSNYNFDRGSAGAIDKWQNSWNLGIAAELNIWNKGETKYKIRKAESKKEENRKQQELQIKAIMLEVKNAYTNLSSIIKEIETVKIAQDTSKENLRITNLLYKEGMATTTDVLDAQTELASAQNNYYQALYDYQTAYGILEKAVGMP